MLVQRFMDGCGFRLNFRVRNRVAVICNLKIARKPGNQRVFGDEDDIPDAPAQPAARRNYNNDVPAFLRRNKK